MLECHHSFGTQAYPLSARVATTAYPASRATIFSAVVPLPKVAPFGRGAVCLLYALVGLHVTGSLRSRPQTCVQRVHRRASLELSSSYLLVSLLVTISYEVGG